MSAAKLPIVFRYFFFLLSILTLMSACSLSTLATNSDAPSLSKFQCSPGSERIWVVNLGWHTGLVIESRHLSHRVLNEIPEVQNFKGIEIGWGDLEFYMSSGYSWRKGLLALFLSSGSAIHIVGLHEPSNYVGTLEAIELNISHEGMESLNEYLVSSFIQDKIATPLGYSLYGTGHFYASPNAFSINHTCNRWTSMALQAAHCPIDQYRRASSLMQALRALPPLKE